MQYLAVSPHVSVSVAFSLEFGISVMKSCVVDDRSVPTGNHSGYSLCNPSVKLTVAYILGNRRTVGSFIFTRTGAGVRAGLTVNAKKLSSTKEKQK